MRWWAGEEEDTDSTLAAAARKGRLCAGFGPVAGWENGRKLPWENKREPKGPGLIPGGRGTTARSATRTAGAERRETDRHDTLLARQSWSAE